MWLPLSSHALSCCSNSCASCGVSGGTPPSQGLHCLSFRLQTVAMSASLEVVVGLVQVCRQVLLFLLAQAGAHHAGAGLDLRDEVVGAAHLVIRASEDGAAVAAHL